METTWWSVVKSFFYRFAPIFKNSLSIITNTIFVISSKSQGHLGGHKGTNIEDTATIYGSCSHGGEGYTLEKSALQVKQRSVGSAEYCEDVESLGSAGVCRSCMENIECRSDWQCFHDLIMKPASAVGNCTAYLFRRRAKLKEERKYASNEPIWRFTKYRRTGVKKFDD